jgi:hypothetical protein
MHPFAQSKAPPKERQFCVSLSWPLATRRTCAAGFVCLTSPTWRILIHFDSVIMQSKRLTRENIASFLSETGLVSYMNSTKWGRLIDIIKRLPFPPAFIFKLLAVSDYEETTAFLQARTVNYWGFWKLGVEPLGLPMLEDFYLIEYIKIKPNYTKSRGKYAEPDFFDIADLFVEQLRTKRIPFEVDEFGNICIFGYK